jgi:hypothetical protein
LGIHSEKPTSVKSGKNFSTERSRWEDELSN